MKRFRVSLREVVYGLEWVTVRLPVLHRGEGEDEGGVAQGGEAGAQGPHVKKKKIINKRTVIIFT